ncbi:SUMO-like protein [Elsinoe australis]|uniref:SUMO-like protein n=1 Tax=Elsinoe australis TaxID=40998 RepID=A0A4U7B7J3_9PEZI|nr:SUMO-like protein [Elsinoe australis]
MATDTNPVPLAPKRSLFAKRPTWASSTTSTSPNPAPAATPEEIFNSPSNALPQLLKEKEERRRRKVEKTQAQARKEREARCKSDEARKESEEGWAKKRRISDKDYERFGLVSPAKKALQGEEKSEEGAHEDVEEETRGRSRKPGWEQEDDVSPGHEDPEHQERTKPMRKSPRTKPRPNNIISLSDDDDEDENDNDELYTLSPRPASKPAPNSPPPDSEEEFPELAALARERRRKRELEAASGTPGSATSAAASKEPDFDPVIKVLVTSPLANTKPLLVHRKLSQRFMEIRQVWCQRQGFDEEMSQGVFLVYKMRKIYDVTTCKSLGIRVDSEGAVLPERSREGFADGEDEAGRVHVVAVTEEAFEEMKRVREEKRRGATGSEDAEEGKVEESEEEVKKIRVVLKAKGFKDYRLKVKPTTTIHKIASAFKREYKLADEQEVILKQDGEALDRDEEVQNTEIEDMDCIEVHLK